MTSTSPWRRRLLVLAQLALVLSLVWWLTGGATAGNRAPEFSMRALDGGVIDTASVRGESVVLYFWATWCTACSLSRPAIDAYAALGGAPVIGVAMDDEETLRGYLAEHPRPFRPVAGGEETARAFGVQALPTTVVLDGEGRIAMWRRGVLVPGELRLRTLVARAHTPRVSSQSMTTSVQAMTAIAAAPSVAQRHIINSRRSAASAWP